MGEAAAEPIQLGCAGAERASVCAPNSSTFTPASSIGNLEATKALKSSGGRWRLA